MKKILSGLISATLLLSLCVPAYATVGMTSSTGGGSSNTPITINTSGGSANVPVNLTADALTFSVTVPINLAVNVDSTGAVTTATNAKILNNSAGPVKVESVTVEAQNGWNLVAFEDLSSEKVGSKKFGVSIQNTGALTNGTCAAVFESIPPKKGEESGSVSLSYDAKVAPQKTALNDVSIANVVFVIGWDEVE